MLLCWTFQPPCNLVTFSTVRLISMRTWCFRYFPYMPYLTLWEKISQNLAHLEANSRKIFQISQNFQNILQQILWRNKYNSNFVVFITSFLHLSKGFWLFWGSSKVIFGKISQNLIKSRLNTCIISDFSPQLMAFMIAGKPKAHPIPEITETSSVHWFEMNYKFSKCGWWIIQCLDSLSLLREHLSY